MIEASHQSDTPVEIPVAAIQMRMSDNADSNLEQAAQQIRAAAAQGARLICLPELFNSPYFCQSEDHAHFARAESIPGPTTDRLGQLARETGTVIVAGLFERRAPGLFHNSAVAIETDGTIAGHYRKMHIPDDPFYFEKFYFTPGDLGFAAIPTSVGKIGVCICWDQWFPEAARLTALAGAQWLVYPTAIGWLADEKSTFGPSQRSSWQTVMRAHAITNGLFVVAPNRVGGEQQIEFWGSSFIVDPYGNMLAEASAEQADQIIAGCDLNLIETARTHWPFFRDRRVDAYGDLTRRWRDD